MRDILFRGKRIDNGEWVYGYLVREDFYTGENPDKFIIMCRDVDYGVIPETVGQYTGLKDKEGNKIFEGDILLENGDAIVIKYGMPYEEYKTYMIYGEMDDGSVWIFEDDEDWKIIGNETDNPELLQ